jgi:hypothetical protein
VLKFCSGLHVVIIFNFLLGKTHTILGTPEDPGIIPRTVKKLFDMMEKEKVPECTYTTHLSFLEIYNERVSKGSSIIVSRNYCTFQDL